MSSKRRRRKKRNKSSMLVLLLLPVACLAGYLAYPQIISVSNDSSHNSELPHKTSPHVQAPRPRSSMEVYSQDITPIFENYCYECHMDGDDKGNLDLDRFTSLATMIADRDTWKKIRDHVNWKLMPPVKKDQPTQQHRQALTQWIDDNLFAIDPKHPDPGPTHARRLNRNEYQNTLRDLLFVELDVRDRLPADDSGDGFDNDAGSLTIAPAHIQRYLATNEEAFELAYPLTPPPSQLIKFLPEKMAGDGSVRENFYLMYRRSSAKVALPTISSGTYTVHIEASQHKAGDENAKLAMWVDGSLVKTVEVTAPHPNNKRHSLKGIALNKGSVIEFVFINDFYHAESKEDRNAMVFSIAVEGKPKPVKPTLTAFRKRFNIVPKANESDLDFFNRVLLDFASVALRRNVSTLEIEKYSHFISVAQGQEESIDHALRLAMQAMLLSPDFLFIDAPHRHTQIAKATETFDAAEVDTFTLASRLSYFLWSAPPDDELLKLAANGQLRNQLHHQVARMLASAKAQALIENFAGQWLQTRDLGTIKPDPVTFPNVTSDDLADLQKETELTLRHILLNKQPLTDILKANYSFLNENLAEFYGIPGVTGDHFRRVDLSDTRRRGLLTQASILMLTSTPTRTSPVMRGKWILENLLDMPPPPPPADIPGLNEGNVHTKGLTLRQELERHRQKSACAACHNMMDPIGFAYENFDAIGKWRTVDVADTQGSLFTGESFKNFYQLQDILVNQKSEEFARCFSKKLLTYALARGTKYYDRTVIDAMTSSLKQHSYSFESAVITLVESAPFQTYRKQN